MIWDKTETSLPIEIPQGEIDWLEMAKPPKEFRSHTCAPHVSYLRVKNMKVSNKTEGSKVK